MEANANKYTWVWKKSCITNRNKVFEKITELIVEMNKEDLAYLEVKFDKRSEYAIEYIEEMLRQYKELVSIDTSKFVTGIGHRKTAYQRRYEKLEEYKEKLKT